MPTLPYSVFSVLFGIQILKISEYVSYWIRRLYDKLFQCSGSFSHSQNDHPYVLNTENAQFFKHILVSHNFPWLPVDVIINLKLWSSDWDLDKSAVAVNTVNFSIDRALLQQSFLVSSIPTIPSWSKIRDGITRKFSIFENQREYWIPYHAKSTRMKPSLFFRFFKNNTRNGRNCRFSTEHSATIQIKTFWTRRKCFNVYFIDLRIFFL